MSVNLNIWLNVPSKAIAKRATNSICSMQPPPIVNEEDALSTSTDPTCLNPKQLGGILELVCFEKNKSTKLVDLGGGKLLNSIYDFEDFGSIFFHRL